MRNKLSDLIEMDKVRERIGQIVESIPGNQMDLAKKMGYSQEQISKVKPGKGRNNAKKKERPRPSLNFLVNLKRQTGYSIDYLLCFTDQPYSVPALPPGSETLPSMETHHIPYFRSLSEMEAQINERTAEKESPHVCLPDLRTNGFVSFPKQHFDFTDKDPIFFLLDRDVGMGHMAQKGDIIGVDRKDISPRVSSICLVYQSGMLTLRLASIIKRPEGMVMLIKDGRPEMIPLEYSMDDENAPKIWGRVTSVSRIYPPESRGGTDVEIDAKIQDN